MAKQIILGALEEVIGEYVLNIDKENLKIAALKGKIKLENVQLDGDLLGGYILGSMGLSGFGILSCWAETVKIYIPLKNLEKEPTRIEMRGCHLVCLPLLPSTANKYYGAGTFSDPRCTLRTRAKRAKLARFEKNYMSGRIPGEGPVAKRILRAAKALELDLKKKSKRRGSVKKGDEEDEDDSPYFLSLVDDFGLDEDDLVASVNQESVSSLGGEDKKDLSASSTSTPHDLPALPRDWKVKLREKIMRNLQASMHNIHVRCEVSDGGLDFCHPDQLRRSNQSSFPKSYDQRAFSFGVTLDNFIVRTANERWEVGSHEMDTKVESTGHLGPNPYDARNNKLITWQNFCMYWDDNPAFLISDTPLIQAPDTKMASDKFHSKLADTMKSLYNQQEPGTKVRESLQAKGSRSTSDPAAPLVDRPHEYCWQGFNYEVRTKTSNRTEPGPISCLAEFLPFVWNIKFRPHQYIQYHKLKSAMLSQRRFDTMVKQRPLQSPIENPKEWWKYAMRCITSRPNARPWEDVQRISSRRHRYIELVLKKLSNSTGSSGYHGGLTGDESAELVALEDLLPVEALFSFHLAALRIHVKSPLAGHWQRKERIPQSPNRARSLARPISRIFGGMSKRSRSGSRDPSSKEPLDSLSLEAPTTVGQESSAATGRMGSISLLDAMVARLGKKVWMTDFKFLHGSINIFLLSATNHEIAMLNCEAAGAVKLMGRGNRNFFFDVTKFEMNDCRHDNTGDGKILVVQSGGDGETDRHDDVSMDLSLSMSLPSQPTGSDALTSFMDLPPSGIVCRLAASRANGNSTKLSFSAHPATLIWTRPCFEAVAEFFGAPSSALQTELSRHLRNAATPLARRAQLAFLSQSELMLHVNVSAPKVWVPLSPSRNEEAGALFFDAGNFRMSCFKDEQQPHSNWTINASDIQVNFAKWGMTEAKKSVANLSLRMLGGLPHPGLNYIIRPFHVRANSTERDTDEASEPAAGTSASPEGAIHCVDVLVSPICLNLVDAEILARSLGRWYSQSLLRVRGRVAARYDPTTDQVDHDHRDTTSRDEIRTNTAPFNLSLSVEKVEMALEGHSKVNFSDELSIESLDFTLFGGYAPTRTYVVEIFNINVRRLQRENVTTTKFLVDDVSVVQLEDQLAYIPMKSRHEANESQYSILQRGTHRGLSQADREEFEDADRLPGVLRASLYHDGTIHLDEVEVDIEAVVLRVTPTTLKDCAKGIRRIVELVQLMTREMERKVHEEGRKARRRRDEGVTQTPSQLSPTALVVTAHSELSDIRSPEETPRRSPSDSSLLFKVTIRDGTLLAGRPTYSSGAVEPGKHFQRTKDCTFAVVQVLSNALIMFQSVENPDASGTQTLHISLDNLSASVNTEFNRISPSELGPMIGPTGAEMRLANSTEDLGRLVSHDISIDCENLKSSLTPNDLSILVSILGTMRRRLHGVQEPSEYGAAEGPHTVHHSAFSLATYQKKGKGIATDVRIELHSFSFVVLRDFKTKYGAPEFLALKLSNLKTRLGGCVSALSGECSAIMSLDFYNAEVSDWEYAVEPFPTKISIDQMPNELIIDFVTQSSIQLNLTGIFLRDLVELDFGSMKNEKREKTDTLTPSALSTVGLRRATESHSVKIINLTGLDIDLSTDDMAFTSTPEAVVHFESIGPGIIKSGTFASIDGALADMDMQNNLDRLVEGMTKLTLRLPPSATSLVGDREAVQHLPIATSSGKSASLHVLKPVLPDSAVLPGKLRGKDTSKPGRASPETDVSEVTRAPDFTYYHAEPVVEWCMQNERLASNTIDIYSLAKGQDLLSSSIWSPEEGYRTETMQNGSISAQEEIETIGEKKASPTRGSVKPNTTRRGNWRRPYLKNDSPEWTDMTCILRMARERVMLPDTSWLWVNDWKVDISGNLGDTTDADGWEYQADFETFTRNRRFYIQGDSCRRRRWTRTRIVRPPSLEDPFRVLRIVWETCRDENGNFKVEVRSHVTLHNKTGSELFFFVFSPSWDSEIIVGSAHPGGKVNLPVYVASAVYLRIARRTSNQESSTLEDYNYTDHIMIVPTSYESSVWVRSSMGLNDVSGTNLHFLLNISCSKGIVDIFVKPVVKVLNLLPCQLECNLGEVCRAGERRQVDQRPAVSGSSQNIANVETMNIVSGKEGKCIALNPASKPHISFRVPGYKWSSWQRVVNRKADSNTWRPTQAEEDFYVGLHKTDGETADEFKLLVCLERLVAGGDPLVLIMSVESGHCPTIRVYAQYWIVDKTGFGCRFCESFMDLMGTTPEVECSRRSHLPKTDARDPAIKRDMNIQGHQWSIGMSGMSLYFSRREKIALSIESGVRIDPNSSVSMKSKWTSAMDISNVMPKTVFSVDEVGGSHRFELAMSVTVAPGLFSRTRIITLIPRYQVVNLLKRELVIAQDGCLKAETLIPSQSTVPFHWEKGSLPSKVRIGAPTTEEKDSRNFEDCWSNGRLQLDKVGITSMRLPTSGILPAKPMVVQAEVRLATKDQNSAVVIVLWSVNENSNPLYLLRNRTPYTILCRQPLHDEPHQTENDDASGPDPGIRGMKRMTPEKKPVDYNCGAELAPMVRSLFGLDRIEEFVWVLRSGESACFGFDDPEKPHILEWTSADADCSEFDENAKTSFVEIDAMGSWSNLSISTSAEIRCQIGAEHSTKTIEFFEKHGTEASRSLMGLSLNNPDLQSEALVGEGGCAVLADEDDEVSFSIRFSIPALCVSVIDNVDPTRHGREILLVQLDSVFAAFSQSREGYHEIEFRLMSLQADNHVPGSYHPILIFYPKVDVKEPFIHLSAVRRLQTNSNTYVFRYAAFRMLDVNIFLDRRTAETVARFIEPVRATDEALSPDETPDFVSDLTIGMAMMHARPDRRAPQGIEIMVQTANSGRIYFEQLQLHPVRIALTFTQEGLDLEQGIESLMVFQFIRGMASIADAPLTFTSFVVAHVFESPQTLFRVIATHYSSQLTKQIFAILGSLAILGAPADFISNVGTGVRDFFYEPIQGAVHGPRQFIEGLEAGTQSLARGVFVGVVRGAANVTEAVNSNLAGLTADDDFIDERKAHQRMLTDAMSRGARSRTLNDSLLLAGASIARGLRSGAFGIVEQPTRYASKHGPIGFVKGVAKAVIGVIVKPVVGVGDAAALLMNHMSDATSKTKVLPKIPKRLRRALPSRSAMKPNCVILEPYDDRAAKAQKIVTGGESISDVYIGHVNIPSHLVIASDQCFWAIDKRSREPWCVSWEEISHFGPVRGGVRVVVFSQSGLKPFMFQVSGEQEKAAVLKLLNMQIERMGNATRNLDQSTSTSDIDISLNMIPGIKSRQVKHVFGSCNQTRKRLADTIKDEIDLIEQCFERVKKMSSESSTFFETLDEEAWSLVSCWGQVFSGLSSRRCIAASVINGTGYGIQIKSTKLMEGGSPCYSIPTSEFDADQGVLHPGGAIIFFGWGVVPSLLQAGNVFMHIETNAFIANLADQKSRDTDAEALPGYQVDFLEKSYDDTGWWAKYWLLLR